MKVLISGGGTGGHVFPAIAIADALKEIIPGSDILFVGARGKLEMEKVPKAGYPIKGLWISGLQRSLTIRNLLFPVKVIYSVCVAFWITLKFRPDVAVGVGGYASGPVLFASAILGIPTLIQEQNSYAGLTNKLLARWAKRVCVAYEGMEKFFNPQKIVITGNPVRKDITRIHELEGRKVKAAQGFDPELPLVMVSGGSLGARTINRAIASGESRPAMLHGYNLLWQVGKLYYTEYSASKVASMKNVSTVAFIEDMTAAYSMADLVVCRAGALTIAELTLIGKPAILIPSPNVSEDHQTSNAMALVSEGAAIMVKDSEAIDQLLPIIKELLGDEEKRKKLANAAYGMAKIDAARLIAEEVIKTGRR